MDTVSYVNKVGRQVNDSTKYRVTLDRTSIMNVTLIAHLTEIYNKLEQEITSDTTEFTQEDLNKIGGYINCMKKEMNFFETKDIVEDGILTEVDELITQE